MPVGFPLPVGWGAGILTDPPADQTDGEADTALILASCGEPLSIQRRENTWDNGIASWTWGDIASISGEWQPVTGAVRMAEAGLQTQSTAQVYTLPDLDVDEDDRVVRADGSFKYINYIEKQSDHWVLRLKTTEPI